MNKSTLRLATQAVATINLKGSNKKEFPQSGISNAQRLSVKRIVAASLFDSGRKNAVDFEKSLRRERMRKGMLPCSNTLFGAWLFGFRANLFCLLYLRGASTGIFLVFLCHVLEPTVLFFCGQAVYLRDQMIPLLSSKRTQR